LLKDQVKLHFIIMIWGFTGILGALISVPALDLVTYRTGIAALSFFVILKLTRIPLFNEQSDTFKLLGVGFLVGLHWVLFFAAVKVGGASIGMIGLSTSAFWSALIAPQFTKMALSWLEILLGIVVVAALAYIFRFESKNGLGLLLSVGAGLLAAIFSHCNGQLVKRLSPHIISFYEMIGALLVCLLALAARELFFPYLYGPVAIPSLKDFGYLLLLALVCTVYPYAASIELLKRLSVFSTNLTVNLEPVYGMVLAALILREHQVLSKNFYFGAFVIVFAVFSYPVFKMFNKRRQLGV
jgi:drug/metabolite transporter (DMT)-like permease